MFRASDIHFSRGRLMGLAAAVFASLACVTGQWLPGTATPGPALATVVWPGSAATTASFETALPAATATPSVHFPPGLTSPPALHTPWPTEANAGPAPTGLGPTAPGRVEHFEVVGRHALGSRGWHAGLALAHPCAYIGNRRLPHVAIVDVSDPTQPEELAPLSLAPGSQPIELRVVPDLGLLVVLNFSPDLTVLTYDVRDCRHPQPLGAIGLGAVPHEFYLWRDPAQPGRLLLYAAMWNFNRPDLLVVDLSNPAAPRPVGRWSAPEAGVGGRLHSLSLSPDGRLAYLALWDGGFLVADTSEFALGLPEPQLRVLAAGGQPAPVPGLAVHSAVPLADPGFVLLTEELYACPFGAVSVADAHDPMHPRLAARFMLPENDPACGGLPQPDAVFTAHNPLVVGHLAFITWYGGGLQVLDLSDPIRPRRVAQYVPDGSGAAGGSYVGTYRVQMWSYPIVRAGLVYVSDIQSGLHILRYTGPGTELVNSVPLAEGNVSVLP